MVPDSGKTLRADTLKPVNLPELLRVEEDSSGLPLAVRTSRRQAVKTIEDRWRIDDEWWRSEAISRLYYALMLASGQRLVVYKDLVKGEWYRQGY
jgi:hypothetical protein